jgi:hypothetical protein
MSIQVSVSASLVVKQERWGITLGAKWEMPQRGGEKKRLILWK